MVKVLMKYFNKILFLLVLIFPLIAEAGQIKEVFGEGVFGVKWGNTIEQVKNVYPNGNLKKQSGYTNYVIQDGRTILGVERKDKNPITFYFDANLKLYAVGIEFPNPNKNFGVLLNKIDTTFGSEHITNNQSKKYNAALVNWKPDEGVSLGLMLIPGAFSSGQLIFSVKIDLLPESRSKKSLGFE